MGLLILSIQEMVIHKTANTRQYKTLHLIFLIHDMIFGGSNPIFIQLRIVSLF